jgi:glycerol-3-phosphate dehydrogenase
MVQQINSICIVGAGTMGSGIALASAQSGFYTLLFDISNDILEKAKTAIQKNLQFLQDKQKISTEKKIFSTASGLLLIPMIASLILSLRLLLKKWMPRLPSLTSLLR